MRFSRILYGAVLAVLVPVHVQAVPADTLRGHVHDVAGRPLVRAEVELVQAGTVALTDREGNFVFALPKYGRLTLVVSAAGYARTTRTLDARPGSLDITMQQATFELAPLEVTALRNARAVGSAPLATSVAGPQELRRNHSISLAHSLQSSPGVRTLATGQQVGKPVVRGLFGSRVLVLESGLRLEDYSWSDEDAPSIDARLADRVEIVRGPASVLYGSDAVGGVVNVIPEALPIAGAGPSFLRTGAELYFASNNREAGTVLRAEGASGNFGWRGTAIGRKGQDLHTPEGELANTGFGGLNGEAEIGFARGSLSSSLRYVRYGGEFKLLEKEGPPVGGEGEEEGPERKLTDDRVQLQAALPLGAMRFELKSQWQRHWLQEVSDELVTEPGQPKREVPVFELLLNTLSTDALLHHESGRVRGTLGLAGILQSNDSRGVLPVVPDVSTLGAAAFAFEQLSAGSATLSAGVRFDVRSTDPTPTKGLATTASALDESAFSGDLGLTLQATPALSFVANVGRAWRAPTLFELYAEGPRIGEARFEIGHADLDAETSLDLDLGMKLHISRFDAEVTAFDNEISDFIYLAPTTEFRDGLRVHRHEQADARLAGVEAAGHVQLSDLRLGAVYDVVRGTNRDLDQPLPVIAPARARLEAEFGTHRIGDHAQLGAALEHVATKHRLAPAETATDGYTLLHASAGVDGHWHGRALHLDLQLHNLTNVAYHDFLSRYREFALSPGRDIVVHFGLGI